MNSINTYIGLYQLVENGIANHCIIIKKDDKTKVIDCDTLDVVNDYYMIYIMNELKTSNLE